MRSILMLFGYSSDYKILSESKVEDIENYARFSNDFQSVYNAFAILAFLKFLVFTGFAATSIMLIMSFFGFTLVQSLLLPLIFFAFALLFTFLTDVWDNQCCLFLAETKRAVQNQENQNDID